MSATTRRQARDARSTAVNNLLAVVFDDFASVGDIEFEDPEIWESVFAPIARSLKRWEALSHAKQSSVAGVRYLQAVHNELVDAAESAGRKDELPSSLRTRDNPSFGPSGPRYDASWLLDAGDASCGHFEPVDIEDVDDDELYRGRKVSWIGEPGIMLRIDADNVVPMMGNMWGPDHFACVYEYIKNESNPVLSAGPARIYEVGEIDVTETQQAEEEGTLGEDGGMSRPWEDRDVGELYAQMLDGNHRAFAAILAGEPYVWVRVAPNYRNDVADLLE
jgi:hypothetical protein